MLAGEAKVDRSRSSDGARRLLEDRAAERWHERALHARLIHELQDEPEVLDCELGRHGIVVQREVEARAATSIDIHADVDRNAAEALGQKLAA
jgi:hypothetical protein